MPYPSGLAAFIEDDGLPSGIMTQLWTQVSGPESITFTDPTNTITDALFIKPGTYMVRIVAGDGELYTTNNITLYIAPEPCMLRLLFSGTGTGSVTLTGGDRAEVRGNYIKSYPYPPTITFTATPAAGSTFMGWVGAYVGTNTNCTVMVNGIKPLSPIFDTTGTGTNIYYVATNGLDTNPGTEGEPWLTIGKATTSVVPGSRVRIGPGLYNYPITNTVQGTALNPIVYEGTRGATGAWLTVIDPSTDFSTGWVSASEIGTGVYKLTNTPFAIRELTISNLHVAPLYTMGPITYSSWVYKEPVLTNGLDYMLLPSTGILHVTLAESAPDVSEPIRFWDSWGALWCTTNVTATNYITYLRLRDGSDPNGRPIRGHPNKNDSHQQHPYYEGAAVKLRNDTYTVWRNLHIRNAFCGFLLDQGSDRNIIENCYFTASVEKVIVRENCDGNIIRNNHATTAFYGWRDTGGHARATGTWEYRFLIRQPHYVFSKYGSSDSGSSFDNIVYLLLAGSSNIVSGNHFWSTLGSGISPTGQDVDAPSTGTRVFDNISEKNPSVGILDSEAMTDLQIFNNDIWDNNIGIRLHKVDVVTTQTVKYCYGNRIWNPNNTATAFYIHLNDTNTNVTTAIMWVYNNTVSGGYDCLDVSDWAGTNDAGPLPYLSFINNICSMAVYLNAQNDFRYASNMLRAFDYNVIAWPTNLNPAYIPVWFGASNRVTQTIPWNTNSLPDFLLASDSIARDWALDVTKTFAIDGTNYDALPWYPRAKHGNAWDAGALEYRPKKSAITHRVQTQRMRAR